MKNLLRRARLAGVLVVVMLGVCATAAAQDFEIRLHRPNKVGDKYHQSVVSRMEQKYLITAGDKVIKNDNTAFTIECDAVVTVLAVDEKGKPASICMAIAKCIRTQGEVKSEVVPKGTVAVLSKKGESALVVEINGKPADAEVQRVLSDVEPLEPGGATYDETLGTRERKKPGDKWSGDAALIALEAREGLTIKKEDVTSSFTLEKVVKLGNMDCLQINGTVEAKNLEMPLPPGSTMNKAVLQVKFASKVPADTTKQIVPESTTEMNMTVVFRLKNDREGPEVTSEFAMTHSRVEQQTSTE